MPERRAQMKEFDVRIRETLEKIVKVKADSMVHAQHIAEKNWKNSDYILEADDFKDVTFQALYPYNRDYER
jgi:hypothetical protein